MSTQDKKIKVVSTADFDNNKIINAKIDASENEVIGVGEITDVLVNGESVVENKIANVEVPTKLSELEDDSDFVDTNNFKSSMLTTLGQKSVINEVSDNSYSLVNSSAISKKIDEKSISAISDIVNVNIFSETLPNPESLGQKILNTYNNKIYTAVNEKELNSNYTVTGNLRTDKYGVISGFRTSNYLTFESAWWHYLTPLKIRLQLNSSSVGGQAEGPIFIIYRSDDDTPLFDMKFMMQGGSNDEISFSTYKRDGTVIETYYVRFVGSTGSGLVSGQDYVFEMSESPNFEGTNVSLTFGGAVIFNQNFKSLMPSGNVGDDFYYNMGGYVKLVSISDAASEYYNYSLSRINGTYSYISKGSYGPASKIYMADDTENLIWDDGENINEGKLLLNKEDNKLYQFTGTNLVNVLESNPIVIDRSGPILPERANFNDEKFLNTTDDKLYSGVPGIYILNTQVSNEVTFNELTSVVSDFVYIPTPQGQYYPPTFKGIQRNNCAIDWVGSNKILRVHFKLDSVPENDIKYTILSNALGASGTPGETKVVEIRLLNKKLYLALYSYQYGSGTTTTTQLCNSDLIANQEYYLEVIKDNDTANVSLSLDNYNENVIETNVIETTDNSVGSGGHNYICYGIPAYYYAGTQSLTIGQIYLNDSMGEFTAPGFIWDNGENLKNDKQYLDKTNNILYYYHNNELNKVGGGSSEQVTLLSITTEPQGEFVKGSQYYNSSTRKIYIAIDDDTWGSIGENPLFGVIYIYDDNGTTKYYLWDGDNLIETDLEKYQLISNISQDIDETSQTKYTSSYVTNSLKPEIVTKSDSELPQPTELKVNDTFLNTTNKKIYTVDGIYKWSDDVYHSSDIQVNLITGAATHISVFGTGNLAKSYTAGTLWNNNKNYKIKFKQVSNYNNPTLGIIAFTNTTTDGTTNTYYYIGFELYYDSNDNKCKIKYVYSSSLRNNLTIIDEVPCLNTAIDLNKEYTLLIDKVDTTCEVSLLYDDIILETNSFQTPNLTGNVNSDVLRLGVCYADTESSTLVHYLGDRGYIYLLDTSGDFLVSDGEFSWEEVKTLGDYTWCIDKTNKLIYYNSQEKLYKNYIIPDQTGQNGKFLTTNGTSLSWAEAQGSGSSYVAGAGIDEEELAENNKIAVKQNVGFRNLVFVFPMSSIPSNKVTINQTTFATYTGNNDNNFYSFDYDGSNWKLNNNTIDLNDYGITIDSSYVASDGDSLVIAGNFFAGKTEFEIIMLEFNNVFLNGILLFPDVDYTLEETQDGIKIKFIDYTLKATDRIQVL